MHYSLEIFFITIIYFITNSLGIIIYKNAKFQIDGIVQEDINVEEIWSIDVRYSDKTIKLLSLNEGNNRVDVIREKIINS